MNDPKIYVMPPNLTGEFGLEALPWEEDLAAILKTPPEIKVALPKDIQDMGEGCELAAWYDSENDRTIVNISGAFMNHDVLTCRGLASTDELIKEFRRYITAEQEWVGDIVGEALKDEPKN
jgi:hypothetical protein